MRRLATIGAFLLGGLLVAVIVLTIHDQQTISTLKRYHQRLKALEAQSAVAKQRRRA